MQNMLFRGWTKTRRKYGDSRCEWSGLPHALGTVCEREAQVVELECCPTDIQVGAWDALCRRWDVGQWDPG